MPTSTLGDVANLLLVLVISLATSIIGWLQHKQVELRQQANVTNIANLELKRSLSASVSSITPPATTGSPTHTELNGKKSE
jgi:hypothetical protein